MSTAKRFDVSLAAWSMHKAFFAKEIDQLGMVEMTPMTKFELSGPNAAQWLDRIIANRLPSRRIRS